MGKVEGRFFYRRHWRRYLVAIPLVLLLRPIQVQIASSFSKPIAYIVLILIMCIFLYSYLFCTRSLFLKEGQYVMDQESISFYYDKNEDILKYQEIKEILYDRRSVFGEEYALLCIKLKDKKRIKFISKEIKRNELDSNIEFYNIYKYIDKCGMFDNKEQYENLIISKRTM